MLEWDHWNRTSGCRYHMDRNDFAGTNFSAIFWEAMRKVFTNEASDPGMIERGEIWREVENIIDWNPDAPISPIGFNREQAQRHLYFGDFRGLRLRIEGPDVPRDVHVYARASVGTVFGNLGRIWFNFYHMIQAANANFPQNATGVDMLVYWTGAVMLHEVMHCMGFTHGARINNDPAHPYNRTLPQVAYRAVLGASPYAGTILLLTPEEIRPMLCGNAPAELELHADEGGFHPSDLSLPRDIPRLYTEVAYENFMRSAKEGLKD